MPDQNASTILSEALALIPQYSDFETEANEKVVRTTIEKLYAVSCDDSTFEEYVRIFLHLAFDKAENQHREFRLFRHRDMVQIFFTGRDILDQTPIWTFRYGYVFERPRISWHQHFMAKARQAASRTNCRSGRAVGVQVVRDKVPLISSYNGVPAGFPHPKTCLRFEQGCPTGEGLTLCPCNHAEQNVVGMSAKLGIPLYQTTLYVTSRPCPQCIAALTIVQPERIVFDDAYANDTLVDNIASRGNLQIIHIRELEDNNII